MISANLYTFLFNIAGLCFVAAALLILKKLGRKRSHSWAIGLGFASLMCLILPVSRYTGTRFGLIRLVAYVLFMHFPIYLIGLGVIFRRQSPRMARGYLALAALVLLTGIEAFIIEPHWLAVNRITLQSAKINEPVRLVLIADIQTDYSGKYEQNVMDTAMAQQPDLLLFAGDYIHLQWDSENYRQELGNLRALINTYNLQMPLGAYAVAGNVDAPGSWYQIFEDNQVIVIQDTTSFDLGQVELTGLALSSASSTQTTVSARDKYHIVLGHNPNFSLGNIHADLLLAGHTHGGQVRLPFLGPVLTLSAIPRSWAAGVTALSSGSMLVVSRGIGMERMDAPRMRFLCRPEIIVIDLVPA